MAVTIELYEDYGPLTSGRGTGTKKVFEAVLSGEEPSASNPSYNGSHVRVNRPVVPGSFNYSYNRFFYVKCTGDYGKVYKLEWYIEQPGSHVTDLTYTTTNTYTNPTSTNYGGTIITGPTVIQANVSLTAPNLASSFTPPENGQTFYSNYLVLQQRVGYMDAVAAQFTHPININCIAWETGEF